MNYYKLRMAEFILDSSPPVAQPYVTELDLRLALLPQGSIDYLKAAMPKAQAEGVEEAVYDYEGYLTGVSRTGAVCFRMWSDTDRFDASDLQLFGVAQA